MTFSKSLGSFVALVIVAFILIVAIALIKLPVDILNILWYSLVIIIFLTAIAYIAYRRANEHRIQQRTSHVARTDSTNDQDEPRIGQTYRFDEED